MKASILLSPEMNEVIFEGRNKLYGAYFLRKIYERNMSRAIASSLLFFILCISSPYIIQLVKGDPLNTDILITSPVINLENIKKEIPILPIIAPPSEAPPPIKSQIKFVPPAVVKDEETANEELPPGIDELKNLVIGSDSINSDTGQSGIGLPEQPVGPIIGEDPAPEPAVFNSYAVQQMPEFAEGTAAMYKFLSKHLKYAELAKEIGLEGTVHIRFVVSKEGIIEQVEIIRGIGGGLDQEALRVVNLMPAWRPGKHNGKPVAVYFTLPVKFKLLK